MWEEKFIDSDVNLQAAVYYDEEDVPQGYLFYRIMEENYYIDEIVYIPRKITQRVPETFVSDIVRWYTQCTAKQPGMKQ